MTSSRGPCHSRPLQLSDATSSDARHGTHLFFVICSMCSKLTPFPSVSSSCDSVSERPDWPARPATGNAGAIHAEHFPSSDDQPSPRPSLVTSGLETWNCSLEHVGTVPLFRGAANPPVVAGNIQYGPCGSQHVLSRPCRVVYSHLGIFLLPAEVVQDAVSAKIDS